MFDAYIETLENWYNILDEKTYDDLLGVYFELAHACGEGICDFIVNVAMHFEEWGRTGRQARLNVLRHYRRIRND